MSGSERYSTQRLTQAFTAHVLFSARLEVEGPEVLAAATEDYPEIIWPRDPLFPGRFDTGGISMLVADDMSDTGSLIVTGRPGPLGLARGHIGATSAPIPGADTARRFLVGHSDHLSISVSSLNNDMSVAARFAAARKMACLAGVLAKLPTAVGVYFPSADLVVTPNRWLHGVQLARKGQLPLSEWFNIVWTFGGGFGARELWSASTVGLAAFTGHEINVPRAPVSVATMGQVTGMAARMLVEAGHIFHDFDTLDGEGEPAKWRIRHMAETPDGPQTDLWVLLHPEADIQEDAVFGPRPLPFAPTVTDNPISGDWTSLHRGLEGLMDQTTH